MTQEEKQLLLEDIIEWIGDEAIKIYDELEHDRIDPYRQGVIDGFKKVIKKVRNFDTL